MGSEMCIRDSFEPHLKAQSGSDPAVVEFMNSKPETPEFLDRLTGFLDYLMPQYEKEGKSYVTVAIGCTGGRHRSVFLADALGRHFGSAGYRVRVNHRDFEKS